MTELYQLKCEACHSGAPKVTENEKIALLATLPDWQAIEVEGVEQLERCIPSRTSSSRGRLLTKSPHWLKKSFTTLKSH